MTKRLIVVVPTAGVPELLPQTLNSLAECDLPSSFWGTIVIENGTAAGARAVAATAPDRIAVEYRHVERANKSLALNHLFDTFDDADLVYLIDDDIRLSPNCLIDFDKAAAGKSGGHVFGGPLRIDSEGEPPTQWLDMLPPSMKGWEPLPEDFDPRSSYFLGANWAVFAGDVRKAGGFDYRFGPGSPLNATGQEWRMQALLRKLGAIFHYLPEAVVWHKVDHYRFSPDFLLDRKYRGGLEAGIRSADFIQYAARWHDHIRTPTLRTKLRLYRSLLSAWVCRRLRNTSAEFKHKLAVQHAKGFLYAYRITMGERN